MLVLTMHDDNDSVFAAMRAGARACPQGGQAGGACPGDPGGRPVSVAVDDVGRDCVSRADARQLVAEHREDQARRARLREEQERRAIEAAEAFRASLPRGIPAGAVPEGMTAAQLMMLSDPMDQAAERESVLEHSLNHRDGAIVFHPLPRGES